MNKYTPEDYINYRLQRARETLDEIKILIDNKLWNTAINRLYYACFYAVGALLVKHGMRPQATQGVDKNLGNYLSIQDL